MKKSLVGILLLVLCPLIAAQQALNNDAVIKMVKAGLSDDVIIATINSSAGAYDTTPDGLIALKTAGVSDKVIAAVVAKGTPAASATAPAPPPPAPLPPGVQAVGAYYKDSTGAWQPLPSEVVVFESGGTVKHFATATLVKQDLNGVVGGMRSKQVVTTPVTFILHVPDGRTINDFLLIRFRAEGSNREFRYAAGGLEKETTGSLRDVVDFTGKQIGPSAYQVVLDSSLGQGEFGFLGPIDTASKTAPSSATIFTFGIVK